MSHDNAGNIFFVDDDDTVNKIISETLEDLDYKVTCFTDAGDCIKNLQGEKCDLLITDLRLPEMDGIELLRRVKLLAPWVPVVILTGYGDVPTAVECIKAGAVDFIEKPLDKGNLIGKVKSVLQENGNGAEVPPGGSLTWAEKRVVKLVVDGKSSKDIARLLNRSKRTVDVHRANAMRKLGAENLIDLVKRASEMGLVRL